MYHKNIQQFVMEFRKEWYIIVPKSRLPFIPVVYRQKPGYIFLAVNMVICNAALPAGTVVF